MTEIVHSDAYRAQLEALIPDEAEREAIQEGLDWVLGHDPDAGIVLSDESHDHVMTVRAVEASLRNGDTILIFTHRENDKVVLAEAHRILPF